MDGTTAAVATGCGGVITGDGATTGCGTGTGAGGATACGAVAAGAGRFIRTTGTAEGGGALGIAAGGSVRTSGTEAAGVAVVVGTFRLIRGGAAGDDGVAFATFGGGGAISGGGAVQDGGGVVAVADADNATGPVTFPNCRLTSSLIRGDKSAPHSGQANVTGFRTISGEASKAYLLPQSHWIFIRHQGLGFNNMTFVASGSAIDAADGDDFIPPSQNKKVPPYL